MRTALHASACTVWSAGSCSRFQSWTCEFPISAHEEACNHAQGDLALLARGGSRGIPAGHIVSHNAHHGLHLKFLRALQAAVSEADYVDVEAPAAAADSGAPAAKE
jgi:hypothetical protein